jgi:flagellar biosynthesis component FlhA
MSVPAITPPASRGGKDVAFAVGKDVAFAVGIVLILCLCFLPGPAMMIDFKSLR